MKTLTLTPNQWWRGGACPPFPPPPLILGEKKEEKTNGRKAGWASKLKPGRKSGSATVPQKKKESSSENLTGLAEKMIIIQTIVTMDPSFETTELCSNKIQ